MTVAEWLELAVTETRSETAAIRSVWLARPHGEPLPAWSPGSHIKLRLPDGDTRSYSLVNFAADPSAASKPGSYRLGVRLEDKSAGGSRYVHDLAVGDRVAVSAPSNDFMLEPGDRRVVLIAGGIGVTPIASMIAHLSASRRDFRAVYLARTQAQMAFGTELSDLAGEKLSLHFDDRDGVFDLEGLMRGLVDEEPVYLCGPRAMIDHAIATAAALGWPEGRLHFEIFSAAPPQAGDTAFEVELRSSQRTLTIPPDKTILDVMIEAGLDPMYDCKRGDCGICQATVLDGVPDHRDYILSASERAAGKLIQICVSRSKTPRLVLDL